jgi:hypothetical protein
VLLVEVCDIVCDIVYMNCDIVDSNTGPTVTASCVDQRDDCAILSPRGYCTIAYVQQVSVDKIK